MSIPAFVCLQLLVYNIYTDHFLVICIQHVYTDQVMDSYKYKNQRKNVMAIIVIIIIVEGERPL